MKKILIAGITGQDGSLLKEFLQKKKFKILGLSRKKNKNKSIIKTNYSFTSLKKIILSFKPNEIYNLSGLTKPSLSWEYPYENFYLNFTVTLNFLEVIRKYSKKTKYFNAGSSEIFENSPKKLHEKSKIFPSNPYGIAKSASHFLINTYRNKYKLFLVNGILFNHESYKNTENYLLKYLLKSSKKIKENKQKNIKILDSRPVRDFGCAKDFVQYFYKLMQLKKSDDFIIATGKSHSVKNVAKIFQKKFDLKSKHFKFSNAFDFRMICLHKKANNQNLIKKLKIRKIKYLPEVIDTLIKDDSL